MDDETTTISFAEEVARELRKSTPGVSLGFPAEAELERLKTERLERDRLRWQNRQAAEDREFQNLKVAALARLRKDRP